MSSKTMKPERYNCLKPAEEEVIGHLSNHRYHICCRRVLHQVNMYLTSKSTGHF
jgi:hypothetical protein